MSDEYTPTTEDVAADYVANRLFVNANIYLTTSRVRAEFDRWLAEYAREQREIGWDGGWDMRSVLNHEPDIAKQFENPYRKT